MTLNPIDVQFLAGIASTDIEIVNFFGLPAYKLNMGKEAYNANAEQKQDYLRYHPGAIPDAMGGSGKAALVLCKSRTACISNSTGISCCKQTPKPGRIVHQVRIFSGAETPNEARAGGRYVQCARAGYHLVPSNYAIILPDGSIQPRPCRRRGPKLAGSQ